MSLTFKSTACIEDSMHKIIIYSTNRALARIRNLEGVGGIVDNVAVGW